MTPESIRVHPDVVSQRLQDEVVLVNLQTNRIFALNRTAARFWELLAANTDRDEIVRIMCGEFEVSEDHLRTEIDSLLSSLAKEHLVAGGEAA